MSQQSKILVTGGTGFLGAYILKQLIDEGFAVKAIRRENSTLPRFIDTTILQKVEWVTADILDVNALYDAMADIEIVIHAAAVVSFNKADHKKMWKVNVEGTANVVNTALDAGVKRLVYISSVAALGRKGTTETIDEAAKWVDTKSNTAYALSKYKAEKEVWRGFAEGLEGVILNPATILGYGDWHSGSCAIFKKVHDGLHWYTHGTNGFTCVEDVARATVALMKTGITEERFIICNENWAFKKLLNVLADAFEKKRPQREATPLLSAIAWRWEWLKSIYSNTAPVLTKDSAKIAAMKTRYDNTKLLKALPSFRYSSLETAVQAACTQYTQAML